MSDFERDLRQYKAQQESLQAETLRALQESYQQGLANAVLAEKEKKERKTCTTIYRSNCAC